MSTDSQGTKCRIKIAENYNHLSRVHERYRQQLDGRQQLASVNILKMGVWWRWALVSPDGVALSRVVCVSASVNLPLHQCKGFCFSR